MAHAPTHNKMTAVFDTFLENFAKKRSSEVSETEKANFVSVEVAWRFFEEGVKVGEKDFKKEVNDFIRKQFSKHLEASKRVISHYLSIFEEKGYTARKLFLSVEPNSSKMLIAVAEEVHSSSEFLDLFYSVAADFEASYLNDEVYLQIGVIDDGENLNLDLLKCDGYSFSYDLLTERKLY